MFLVDTSVWVDHLCKGDEHLRDLLCSAHVAVHPFVVGELACGGIRNRKEVLELLQALPTVGVARHEEVLMLLECESLHGIGLGYVDAHLLAACRIERILLWTRDKTLRRVAEKLNVYCDV